FFLFQAEDGIRDFHVTGVQTCALPICFRGATLDQIAEVAGLSKPNLLYYFPSKEAIHVTLLSGMMHAWLDPLRKLDPEGDPVSRSAERRAGSGWARGWRAAASDGYTET